MKRAARSGPNEDGDPLSDVVVRCSSAERNVFNEAGCKISYHPDACVSRPLPDPQVRRNLPSRPRREKRSRSSPPHFFSPPSSSPIPVCIRIAEPVAPNYRESFVRLLCFATHPLEEDRLAHARICFLLAGRSRK